MHKQHLAAAGRPPAVYLQSVENIINVYVQCQTPSIFMHVCCFIIGRKRDEPDCRPTFKIKGLEREYIKQLLFSKCKSLKINDMEYIIDDLIKTSTIRENKTNPHTLDQRNLPALTRLHRKGILPNLKDSPTWLIKSRKPRQGEMRFDKNLKNKYHFIQEKLLRLLITHRMLTLPCNTHLDNKGFVLWDNGDIIPTGMFCNILDECTIVCSHKTFRNCDAQTMCSDIFALRSIMDMCNENDLIKIVQYDVWLKHLHVFASFGVLCCVLNLNLE